MIFPSLYGISVEDTLKNLESVLDAGAKTIHYDVMDGSLVPNSFDGLGQLQSSGAFLKKYGAVADVHLAVTFPQNYLSKIKELRPSRASVHFESECDLKNMIDELKKEDIEVGLALTLKSHPSIEELQDINADFFHLVCNNEKNGVPQFQDSIFQKIADLSKLKKNITADCGIKRHHLLKLKECGIQNVVLGSALFAETEPGKTYANLSNLFSQ